MSNFEESFARLIGHEGGYQSPEEAIEAKDPGGETNFGISRRSYPKEDIKGMTLERAKALYLRDFWGPTGCDCVPPGVKYALFDFAVNSGPRTAAKFLQRVVGVAEDGSIGPMTLQAVNSMQPERLTARFYGHRLELMTTLVNWTQSGRGWARRVAAELKEI